jgi:heptosyltransferase-2
MALPALAAARRLWPGAALAVQAHDRVRPLFEENPLVDRVLPVPARGGPTWAESVAALRRGAFHTGVLLTGSFSSALLFALGNVRERVGWRGGAREVLLSRALSAPRRDRRLTDQYLDIVEALGDVTRDSGLSYAPPDADVRRADLWLLDHGLSGRHPVALAPGAVYGPAKRWPAERFRELARRLSERDVDAVVIGTSPEASLLREIAGGIPRARVMAGDLSLREVCALVSRCRALIGNDTGLLHVARAVGTPVIGIYGSTNPVWTGPDPGEGEVVTLGLRCSPCYRRECPLREDRLGCLRGITVEMVEAAFDRWDGGSRPRDNRGRVDGAIV